MLFCIIIDTLLLLFSFGVPLHVLFLLTRSRRDPLIANNSFVLGSLLISPIFALFLLKSGTFNPCN